MALNPPQRRSQAAVAHHEALLGTRRVAAYPNDDSRFCARKTRQIFIKYCIFPDGLATADLRLAFC